MKLAFTLVKYFPYGGMQHNFTQIVQACQQRGHEVDIYCHDWQGDKLAGANYHLLPARSHSNHGINLAFAKAYQQQVQHHHYDLRIGFNRLPGLDLYYAADPCFAARKVSALYKLTPRYRAYCQLEQAVFSKESHTHILLVAKNQQSLFQQYYQTADERFNLLPPGINKTLLTDINQHALLRTSARDKLAVQQDQIILLMVGSAFQTKGLDRSLRALASLPDNLKQRCQVWIVGVGKDKPFTKLARQLGIAQQCRFWGGQKHIQDYLHAADLLLHPAYRENTGNVLLEAMISGLPVLASGICGYAEHVQTAQAGLVLTEPFQQAEFDAKLLHMLTQLNTQAWASWSEHGMTYGQQQDLYSRYQHAVDVIETLKL